jgi:hypothetical protein
MNSAPAGTSQDLARRGEAAAKHAVADAVVQFLDLPADSPRWEALLGELCERIRHLCRLRRSLPAMAGPHLHHCSGCGARGHNRRTCRGRSRAS